MTDAPIDTSTAAPLDVAGATARKAELMADKDWVARKIAGDPEANREMSALLSVIVGSPPVETVDPSQVEYARSLGIKDDIIAQFEDKTPLPQAEYDAIARWKASHLKDQAFLKKLADGDYEARQQMTIANMALLSPIKQAS